MDEIEELMDNLTDEQVDAVNAGVIEKMLDPEPIDDRLDAMGELLSRTVRELEKAEMMVPTQWTPDTETKHPSRAGNLLQGVKNEYQLIINLREESRIVWKEAPNA